jgi:hypothetical protein
VVILTKLKISSSSHSGGPKKNQKNRRFSGFFVEKFIDFTVKLNQIYNFFEKNKFYDKKAKRRGIAMISINFEKAHFRSILTFLTIFRIRRKRYTDAENIGGFLLFFDFFRDRFRLIPWKTDLQKHSIFSTFLSLF